MGNDLKPLGPTEQAIRAIAMDVGKEVVEHIEHAHPEMTEACRSWKSTRLSIRNTTHNAIVAAVEAADRGRDREAIKANDRHRRKMRKYRKLASEAPDMELDQVLSRLAAINAEV